MESDAIEVIVGNIGTVYSGNGLAEALKCYVTYVRQSRANTGRAGDEPVTMFRSGDIWLEHTPEDTKLEEFKVIVGNIGTVYSGNNAIRAIKHYRNFKYLSETNQGGGAGEPVFLYQNDKVLREYDPTPLPPEELDPRFTKKPDTPVLTRAELKNALEEAIHLANFRGHKLNEAAAEAADGQQFTIYEDDDFHRIFADSQQWLRHLDQLHTTQNA